MLKDIVRKYRIEHKGRRFKIKKRSYGIKWFKMAMCLMVGLAVGILICLTLIYYEFSKFEIGF